MRMDLGVGGGHLLYIRVNRHFARAISRVDVFGALDSGKAYSNVTKFDYMDISGVVADHPSAADCM